MDNVSKDVSQNQNPKPLRQTVEEGAVEDPYSIESKIVRLVVDVHSRNATFGVEKDARFKSGLFFFFLFLLGQRPHTEGDLDIACARHDTEFFVWIVPVKGTPTKTCVR